MQQRLVACHRSVVQHGISAQSHSLNNYTGCLCWSKISNWNSQFWNLKNNQQIFLPNIICSNCFQCFNWICLHIFLNTILLWHVTTRALRMQSSDISVLNFITVLVSIQFEQNYFYFSSYFSFGNVSNISSSSVIAHVISVQVNLSSVQVQFKFDSNSMSGKLLTRRNVQNFWNLYNYITT